MVDNLRNSIQAMTKYNQSETCQKMADRCIKDWDASGKPWSSLSTCYKKENNLILNDLGQTTQFSVKEYDDCATYLANMKKENEVEGFTNPITSIDSAADLLAVQKPSLSSEEQIAIENEINEINDAADGNGITNRQKVQDILDEYDTVKTQRDKAKQQLDEMQIKNNDLELQTNSMIYTTLFATALGTCVLYYFARQL
jgi:hypothetical protein